MASAIGHLLFLIGLGGRKQNHKKRKQKRDEVGIGNQPAVMGYAAFWELRTLMRRAPPSCGLG